jgi:hypothetical protein
MIKLSINWGNRYRRLSYSIQKLSRFIRKYIKACLFHIVFLIFVFTVLKFMMWRYMASF